MGLGIQKTDDRRQMTEDRFSILIRQLCELYNSRGCFPYISL